MKKFYFALDTVLNYKEQVLENLQAEHAQIIAERVECERGIEALEQEQRECMVQMEEKKTFGISITDMQTYDRFLTSLRKKIERERERLAEILLREERKRGQVVEARKETASITKLKDKKRAQYDKEVQKADEQFIDEFVSNKRAVARA
ncbi:flagellar export protein FliJ [Candidatus Merdisoma sp. JLR.KK011]|uniref:flagellar export protein FliJ n=1 Tax=Candidatus Merdisoma sp. JLR.KK011 TaxID=3114299 RepID=UPI002FF15EA2